MTVVFLCQNQNKLNNVQNKMRKNQNNLKATQIWLKVWQKRELNKKSTKNANIIQLNNIFATGIIFFVWKSSKHLRSIPKNIITKKIVWVIFRELAFVPFPILSRHYNHNTLMHFHRNMLLISVAKTIFNRK